MPLDVSSPLYAAIRFVMYGATIGLIGAAFFVLLIVRRLRALGLGSDLFAEDAAAAARRLALLCAAVLLVATVARLYAQSLVFDVSMRDVVGVRWGRGWMLQAAGAGLAVVAAWSARGVRVARWRVAGLGGVAVAVGFALTGHANAAPSIAPLVMLSDVVHQVAAAAWVGTLAAIAFAGLPAALRAPDGDCGPFAACLIHVFSPLALFSAAVLLVTGAFAAWEQLGSLAALFTSGYGRTLLVKLGAVAAVAAIGGVNWRVLRPVMGTELAARRIHRSAFAELAVALVVIAVTAVLVAIESPGDQATSASRSPIPVPSISSRVVP